MVDEAIGLGNGDGEEAGEAQSGDVWWDLGDALIRLERGRMKVGREYEARDHASCR